MASIVASCSPLKLLLDGTRLAAQRSDMVTVSVVVITRNRPREVEKCYLHLARQTTPAHEVIIVDNSTDERTKKLVAGFQDTKYLHVAAPLGCQPLLRNRGIHASSGDVVAFVDDDGYAEGRWLEYLSRVYEVGAVGGAGGRIIQGEVAKEREHVGKLRLIGGVEGNWNFDGESRFEVDHLQGTNMSFRRELLGRIGNWDVEFRGYEIFGEADVCLRIKKLGYQIIFEPRAVVVHGEVIRQGHFGRTVNISPKLAYYTGRNGVYLYLKNFGFSPKILSVAIFVNPMIEILRCMFGSAQRPRIRKLSLIGFGAACMHVLGVVRGLALSFGIHPSTRSG